MHAVCIGLIGVMLASSGAPALGGEFQGSGSESSGYRWQLHPKITPESIGRYKVQVTSTNATCASETVWTGTFHYSVFTVGGECPLTIALKVDDF